MIWSQLKPLILIMGKGGVGRSAFSSALGGFFAQKGERTLICQMSLKDQISPFFHLPPQEGTILLRSNLFTYNYDYNECIKEYFLEYLKWKEFGQILLKIPYFLNLFHQLPALKELFFWGRLHWLRNTKQFDRILIDAPATGHGLGFLSVLTEVEKLKWGGRMKEEIQKVSSFIKKRENLSYLVVSLPQRVVWEETKDLLKDLENFFSFPQDALILNQVGLGPENKLQINIPNNEKDHLLSLWKNRLLFFENQKKHALIPMPQILSCLPSPQPQDIQNFLEKEIKRTNDAS